MSFLTHHHQMHIIMMTVANGPFDVPNYLPLTMWIIHQHLLTCIILQCHTITPLQCGEYAPSFFNQSGSSFSQWFPLSIYLSLDHCLYISHHFLYIALPCLSLSASICLALSFSLSHTYPLLLFVYTISS